MANEKKVQSSKQVLTPEFRVSFPNVFQARAAMEGQDPKFGLTMLFPKNANLNELKAAVKEAVVNKWGADPAKWPVDKLTGKSRLRLPFRAGEEKDYAGYGPDIIFASATSKIKPGLVGPDVKPIIDPSEFYAGCYARATVTAFAYDVKGNVGIALGLRNVQKVRDGEPLGGKNSPENDFDAIAVPSDERDTVEANDPLAGIGA